MSTYRKIDEGRRYDFDVRNLAPNDDVEVFVAGEGWTPGIFDVSTSGVAYVKLETRAMIRLDGAMQMGLRRIVREPPN